MDPIVRGIGGYRLPCSRDNLDRSRFGPLSSGHAIPPPSDGARAWGRGRRSGGDSEGVDEGRDPHPLGHRAGRPAGGRATACPWSTTSCASWPPSGWPRRSPGQTLQATALVHEAYLRLVGDERPSAGTAAATSSPPPPRPCGGSWSSRLGGERRPSGGGRGRFAKLWSPTRLWHPAPEEQVLAVHDALDGVAQDRPGHCPLLDQAPILRRDDHGRGGRCPGHLRPVRAGPLVLRPDVAPPSVAVGVNVCAPPYFFAEFVPEYALSCEPTLVRGPGHDRARAIHRRAATAR